MLVKACLCPVADSSDPIGETAGPYVAPQEKQHFQCGQTAASDLDHQVKESVQETRVDISRGASIKAESRRAATMQRAPAVAPGLHLYLRACSLLPTTVLYCHAQQPAISTQ